MIDEQYNPWTIEAEKEIYANPWISLTEYNVINPSGGKGIYGKVHFKNYAIGIVPLDENLNVYLVGQYRFVLNRYSWEIPEGGCPEGTDPLDTARRELREETGMAAEYWEKILDIDISNSVSDEIGFVFLARELSQGYASPEDTEELAVKKMHIDEVYRLVVKGEITDSVTIAAILRVKLMISEGVIK